MTEVFSTWGNGSSISDGEDPLIAFVKRHARNDELELEAREIVERVCFTELAEAATLSTSAQYVTEVKNFAHHCRELGIAPVPVGPGVVGAYLIVKIAEGVGLIRAQRIAAAIGDLHNSGGHPDPTASDYVRAVLRKLRKQQKKGLKSNGKAH